MSLPDPVFLSLDVYPVVELLDHMVILFLIFLRNLHTDFHSICTNFIPINNAQGFFLSTHYVSLKIWQFYIFFKKSLILFIFIFSGFCFIYFYSTLCYFLPSV